MVVKRSVLVCLIFIFLLSLVSGVSSVLISIAPDYINPVEGDEVLIDILGLEDGCLFCMRIESNIYPEDQDRFRFQTTNITMPFSLNDPEIHVRADPVTGFAGIRVEYLQKIISFESRVREGEPFDFTEYADDIPGIKIDMLRVYGTVKPGEDSVDVLLELKGTKEGAVNSSVVFGIEGVDRGSALISIDVDDETLEKKEIIFTEKLPEVAVELELKEGWNMVSLPVASAQLTVPPEVVGDVFWYNPETRSYDSMDIHGMVPGKGYWVAATQNCTLEAEGVRLTQYILNLKKGWNMIGSLYNGGSFSSPNTYPSGSVVSYTFCYNPATRDYGDHLTELEAFKGYWVAATQDCTLKMG